MLKEIQDFETVVYETAASMQDTMRPNMAMLEWIKDNAGLYRVIWIDTVNHKEASMVTATPGRWGYYIKFKSQEDMTAFKLKYGETIYPHKVTMNAQRRSNVL